MKKSKIKLVSGQMVAFDPESNFYTDGNMAVNADYIELSDANLNFAMMSKTNFNINGTGYNKKIDYSIELLKKYPVAPKIKPLIPSSVSNDDFLIVPDIQINGYQFFYKETDIEQYGLMNSDYFKIFEDLKKQNINIQYYQSKTFSPIIVTSKDVIIGFIMPIAHYRAEAGGQFISFINKYAEALNKHADKDN